MMDMLCLPWMIQRGIWLPDKKNFASVLYKDPETGRRFKGAVKVVAEYETYISTFHRCKSTQWESLLKRKRPICGL
jgi:hypothetical protein